MGPLPGQVKAVATVSVVTDRSTDLGRVNEVRSKVVVTVLCAALSGNCWY